ncbi:MAG TPA: hypothetical protein VMB25_14235 [Bryobacteraceae bacterium]|nr:hypothetical protein [Bryobacteraceae bacterium]
MHQPIRDYLEDYLRGAAQGIPQGFQAHLDSCEECAQEIRLLEQHSQDLRALRTPETEPRAGFYARVMERIEAQQASIWSAFLERRFGLRLAVASAALALLMGAYLISSDPGGMPGSGPSVVLTDTSAPYTSIQPELVQQQQRDAVLVNLASYHE